MDFRKYMPSISSYSLLVTQKMATHFSILAWEIPWTEEPDRLPSVASQKSQTRLMDWTTTTVIIQAYKMHEISQSLGNLKSAIECYWLGEDKLTVLPVVAAERLRFPLPAPPYTRDKRGALFDWSYGVMEYQKAQHPRRERWGSTLSRNMMNKVLPHQQLPNRWAVFKSQGTQYELGPELIRSN